MDRLQNAASQSPSTSCPAPPTTFTTTTTLHPIALNGLSVGGRGVESGVGVLLLLREEARARVALGGRQWGRRADVNSAECIQGSSSDAL